MATFSQAITTPVGLADGQTAFSSHVAGLYNALNALVIPDASVPWLRAFSQDTLTTITVGGTATADFTLVTQPAATKAAFFMASVSWTVDAPSLTYRMNAGAVTAATALSVATTGSGILLGYVGGRDTDTPRPFVAMQIDVGAAPILASSWVRPNADLPTATFTSLGLTVTGGASALKVKFVKIFTER